MLLIEKFVEQGGRGHGVGRLRLTSFNDWHKFGLAALHSGKHLQSLPSTGCSPMSGMVSSPFAQISVVFPLMIPRAVEAIRLVGMRFVGVNLASVPSASTRPERTESQFRRRTGL